MNKNKVLTQALEDDFCGVVDVFEALEITISGPAGGYADCFIEVGDNQYRWDFRQVTRKTVLSQNDIKKQIEKALEKLKNILEK